MPARGRRKHNADLYRFAEARRTNKVVATRPLITCLDYRHAQYFTTHAAHRRLIRHAMPCFLRRLFLLASLPDAASGRAMRASLHCFGRWGQPINARPLRCRATLKRGFS